MYAFNSAAIFYPGHPYIESTTVLSDIIQSCMTAIGHHVKYSFVNRGPSGCNARVRHTGASNDSEL